MIRGKTQHQDHHICHRIIPSGNKLLNSLLIFVVMAVAGTFVLGGAPVSAADLDIRIGAGGSDPAPSGGPPAHAPAHGARAKTYRYYPSANVYFEPVQGMYFYLSGGEWKAGMTLPAGLKVQLGDHVSLELGTDHPYELNAEHLIKYKSGKGRSLDKVKRSKGKSKGKGKKK